MRGAVAKKGSRGRSVLKFIAVVRTGKGIAKTAKNTKSGIIWLGVMQFLKRGNVVYDF